MNQRKATYIRIEFDNGDVLSATDETATRIWNWFMGAEAMYCIHGAAFSGQGFTEVKASKHEGFKAMRDWKE